MSIDMTTLTDGALDFANLLVNAVLPILPYILGVMIAGFVIGIFFALPKLLKGQFRL